MKMKTDVMTMTSYDAIQKALEQYDLEPNSQMPKKLLNNTEVDLVAVSSEDLPKHIASGKLVDINLGELLGLGIIGGYYQHFHKKGFNVVIGVADTHKPQLEAILSDGAISEFGSKQAMAVQQVQAQGYYLQNGKTIEDEIIEKIKNKEAKRSSYPKKCALLINVYADEAGVDFKKVMNECNLTSFDLYFCILYLLPKLQGCMVVALDKNASIEQYLRSRISIDLSRA